MDILDILIRAFIWAVVGTFSVIPGIIMGSVLEVSFGRLLFWPGFIIGSVAFIIFVGENLYSYGGNSSF
ncbi:hypothetical protein L1766_01930 [Thermovorax subterraneus]|nr:hypothetical protein [Thermovorax subterraneus]